MLPIKQPPNGAGPRPFRNSGSLDAGRCYMVSLTVFASAILATLVTFGILNFLLTGVSLPPIPAQAGLVQGMQPGQPQGSGGAAPQQPHVPGDARLAGAGAATAAAGNSSDQAADEPRAPAAVQPPPKRAFEHSFDDLQHIYTLPDKDTSPRCSQSQICDGDHTCGPDKRGCITSAKERQDHVRKAIAWAWEGYRKYAWGHDEVDVLSKSPHAWFNLGLTIVDSLDTLLIAGLMEEYQEARHWVANHLVFHDGSTVQFFEVNIRILGGLVSAYYLSDGDDLYLHKAQQLADRLMVAFNTSSGMPVTHVAFRDAGGRVASGQSDTQTNIAEAGTISLEFTSIGRLLGRDDMFDAGMQFWYVLMSSRNYSGLYCMGIHTGRADCYNPQMTIGSAADSTYEYMLKQWVLSNHTQEVPRLLYEESMKGVRKYLVRHVWDGHADMSIVSEARADQNSGSISDTNNRFEHLTCFAGGMFVLGALHNLSTEVDQDDFHDVVLGARIGRACYELYHQTPSGLAPDSVSYKLANGQPLPPRERDRFRPEGIVRHRPGRKSAKQPGAATTQKPLQPALNSQQLPHDVVGASPQASKPAAAAGGTQQPAASASKDAAAAPKPVSAQAQPARKLQDESADRLGGGDAAAAAAARGLALRHLLDQPEGQQQEHHHMHSGSKQAQKAAWERVQHAAHGFLPTRQHAQHPGLEAARRRHAQALAEAMHHGAGGQQLPWPHHHGRQLLQLEEEAEEQPPHRQQHLLEEADAHDRRHAQVHVHGQGEHLHLHEHGEHRPEGHGQHDVMPEVDEELEQRHRRRHLHAGTEGGEGPRHEEEPKRRVVPLDEEHIPRIPAQRQLEGRGDPPNKLTDADAARVAAEQRAAVSEQQARLAAQQRERAQREEAQQRRKAELAAQQRHAQERQQAAAHQQVAQAQAAQQHLSQKQAAQLLQREAAAEEAIKPPAAPSPSPTPPPLEKVAWTQMSAGDFLRPETIETLFYLWRATGDEIYREWGWNMFRAFERWTRLDSGGYATLNNVNSVPPGLANKMESFWVAETLKYFYLLFEDDPNVLPLDQWVFNTEAHPLPIWGTPPDKKAMERLKQRRYAEKVKAKDQQHKAEDDAVAELLDIKQQGAKLAEQAPQRGKPEQREGYGLGGVDMY